MPNAAPNLEPEPEAVLGPITSLPADVRDWTAADYKRARAILAVGKEISASLLYQWMADSHLRPMEQRDWFKKAAVPAGDTYDAISELGRRIDELMKLKQIGGHCG